MNIEEKVLKYSDMVYRIAYSMTNKQSDAEDIYQEVFIKLFEKDIKFVDEEHEKAWIIRVTINLTKNLYNSSWNKNIVELDENIAFESENERDVLNTVLKLPQNYRTVIYLMYYEGYKVKEISEMMKTSEGTIKTWLFRAREELKKELEGGFEDHE